MNRSEHGTSIIIPIAEKEDQHITLIPLLFRLFEELHSTEKIYPNHEIIICGCNSKQETAITQLKEKLGDKQKSLLHFAVSEESGRAKQLNAGAQLAKFSWLWFLHADSLPDYECIATLFNAIDKKQADMFFYFKLAFYNNYSSMTHLTALGANFRSRFLKTPFGDQGFCLTKKLFHKLGQFDEQASYGEDHLLVWRAHHLGIPLTNLQATLRTDARKYNENGWFQQTMVHWFFWFLQATPQLWRLIIPRKTKA